MADWYKTVSDELTAFVKTVWADVQTIGVMTQQVALTRNIVSQFSKGLAGDNTAFPSPWAVIGMGKENQERGLSVDPLLYRLPLKIWYITAEIPPGQGDAGADEQQFCASKVNALLAGFQTNAFTSFQVFGDDTGDVDSSVDAGFAEQQIKIYCASASFDTGLLVRVS